MGSSQSYETYITSHDQTLIKDVYLNHNLISKKTYTIQEKVHIDFSPKEWEDIKKKGEIDIDFCIVNDLNGVEECMGLFKDPDTTFASKLEQFRVEKGTTPCKSWFYRPGLVITDKNIPDMENEIGNIIDGTKCKLVYTDYVYTDKDLERCCFSDNTTKCNANLINGYKTSHCNIPMIDNCKKDPNNPKCLLWLENNYERKENLALEIYSELCSKNFDAPYCDYFCKIARQNNDYTSQYCDNALTKWCQNNSYNSNCYCVFTPSDEIPNLEQYLGPKPCWLSYCASQPNNKWLLTDQINTRSSCQMTGCIITIQHLQMNDNAKIELINDCVSGTKIDSNYYIKSQVNNPQTDFKKIKTPGILFSIPFGLFISSMILLIIK